VQFAYLKSYIDHQDPALRFPFGNYCHYGLSYEEIRRKIIASQADMFFISSLFTTYHEETERVIEIIKEKRPGAPIAAGGYHAALHPGHLLNECGADFVINGEGEAASAALADYVSGKLTLESVPNLAYIKDGSIVYNPASYAEDLDALPHPAREFLKERDFKAYRRRAVSLIASRGCPNRCAFCTSRGLWGNRYRGRGADGIIREIRETAQKYNADWFNFEDDNLFPDRVRAHQILQRLIEYRTHEHPEAQFTAMNGISLEGLDEETIPLMRDAGFHEINISLVTASGNLQTRLGRPFASEKFESIAETARGLGLAVRGYFILGLPEQTRGEISETIAFMESLGISIYPSVYYNVRSPRDEWKVQRSSAFYNETDGLTRNDLMEAFNRITRMPR